MRGAALIDTVLIVPRVETGERDEFGDPVIEDGDPIEVPAFVTPLDATEDEINRDVRLNRYSVILEVEAPIDGLDELGWNGKRYRVIGEPKLYTGAVRGADHYELEMRREEG